MFFKGTTGLDYAQAKTNEQDNVIFETFIACNAAFKTAGSQL